MVSPSPPVFARVCKKVPAAIAAAGVISLEQAMVLRSAIETLRDGLIAHAVD
jgi:hypothetical protein